VFTGDRSGDWLYRALYRGGFSNRTTAVSRDDGLELRDAYIAAAVRCAPPANRPTRIEFARCQPYLRREVALLPNLEVVVALGRVAVDAFLRVWRSSGREIPRPRPSFRHGARVALSPVTLVMSYHPSQRNTSTKLLTEAMFDRIFQTTRRILDEGLRSREKGP
jgi:uracil-DNA glycosylase family 4